jgi:hypothetical protein
MPIRFLCLPAILLVVTFSLHADILFTDITTNAGLNHVISGEGVCIIDFNNDGLEDIFITAFNNRNVLYRNEGNMVFTEIAEEAGIAETAHGRLAIAGDFDNDGFMDLIIGRDDDHVLLFRNNGDWTFTDRSTEAGILATGDGRGGAWFDHDRDGMLDLYLGYLAASNMLYYNNGNETFTDIAGTVNARGPVPSLVLGLAIFDYDRDGDDDIFMAQDGNQGNMLLEKGDHGVYSDVSEEAGVVIRVQGMGVGVGDYNRDGFFDVYTTNLDESTLFRNNGDKTFTDVTLLAGVGDLPNHMGWGTFFFDSDNDGLLDIYNNNQTNFGGLPNTFFRNNGDETFEDLSGPSGLMCYNNGIGSAYGDLDNDGDLDIVLAGRPSAEGSLKLFRNDTNEPNHWVQFTLETAGANRNAIGAITELYTGGIVQTSMVSGGAGYVSQNSLRQHFGLGQSTTIDSLVVLWPDGSREVFDNLLPDTHHLIAQGTTTSVNPDGGQGIPALFRLEQNYPNPFNAETEVKFEIADAGLVRLVVYDQLGQEVMTLVNEILPAGKHSRRLAASSIASGVYILQMKVGNTVQMRKMTLIR